MTSLKDRPNILFILSDDHGYGDTSVYGGEDIRTPNIDRIAHGGIRFTQFYANSPVCSPSRAALLTGRYPDMVGVPGVIRTHAENSWGYFDPGAVTLPQILKSDGYQTAMVGKWHLGLEPENHPCQRGFDHFRGFLGDMMDDYVTHLRHGYNYMRDGEETIDPEGHATDIFTDWAVDYIEDRSEQDDPFFLYLAYNAPHTPIQPPDEWLDRVRQREPDLSEQRARYVALVEHMDHGIGQVLEALEQSGDASNTLVVYASDNGGQVDAGASNAPWRGAKQEMYEGGIRVPCCAMWPGRIPAGQVSDQTAMLMDWFPSICAAGQVPVKHEIDGRSILPLLLGGAVDFEGRHYYWVRREGGKWHSHLYNGLAYHAVRRDNMKLLRNDAFSSLELYSVQDDPVENVNLARTDTDTLDELQATMQQQVQQAGHVPWQKPAD
ncbi:MAG: sulfatase-like hydrolase/transferase [Candidatus Latescibacteria bacterium]|jgi:arylsulfatase A-like enzyme|nr:sulfatase-like hydrolase/transferase [Candidatus Latescibacterota bacterium]